MKARIVFFLLGLLLGSMLSSPVVAQQAVLMMGSNAGQTKPIAVDGSGNVQAIGH